MIRGQKHFQFSSGDTLSPDLTPMLDILFIMLVFFMLTTGIVLQSLELELPSAVKEELADIKTQLEPQLTELEINDLRNNQLLDVCTIDRDAYK